MTVRSKRLLRNISSIRDLEDVKQYLLRLEDTLFYESATTQENVAAIEELLSAPTSSGGTTVNAFTITVDFGAGASSVTTTVIGLTWMESTSKIVATPALTTADHSFEEAALEELQWSWGNPVAGVGFDFFVYAPSGTTGVFTFHCLGV